MRRYSVGERAISVATIVSYWRRSWQRSLVKSRVEPEGQDFLDIQEMPSFSAPSCLASLSALG